MKILTFTLIFLFCSTFAFAQTMSKELLTQKKWVLKSDEMSGIGTHNSLPGDTEIEFKVNGRWIATEGIENLKEGIWVENKKGEIILKLRMKKKAKVVSLTASELKILINYKTKARELVWESKI